MIYIVGTRVYIYLGAKYKNYPLLSGLCGNFDGKTDNELGREDVQTFGNKFKTMDMCPSINDVPDDFNPCDVCVIVFLNWLI